MGGEEKEEKGRQEMGLAGVAGVSPLLGGMLKARTNNLFGPNI